MALEDTNCPKLWMRKEEWLVLIVILYFWLCLPPARFLIPLTFKIAKSGHL